MFAIKKPGVETVPSSFGGGWIFALTDEGTDFLEQFFNEAATPLPPCGGRMGWIVEPQDASDLVVALQEADIPWRTA